MAPAPGAGPLQQQQHEGSASSSGISPLQAQLRQLPSVVRELAAGGIAGGLAKTTVAPLERIKILFQTRRVPEGYTVTSTLSHIWREEGMAGLFRGNAASVLRIVPYAAIHFGAYEHFRRLLVEHLVHPQKPHHPASQPRGPGAPPGSSKAAAGPGSAAGVAGEGEGEGEDVEDGDVLTNIATSGSPIDLAASNATADMDSLEGSTGSTAEESSTGGIGIGDAGAAQLNQPLQQPDQHHHKQHHHHLHIHPGWDLLAGSAAGATAVLATYPLDLIRTRLAWASPGLSSSTPSSAGGAAASSSSSVPGASSGTAAAPHPTGKGSASAASIRSSSSHGHGARPAELSIRGAFIATAKSEGMVGLFKGLGPTLLGILPYAGLKFYVYQSLKAWYRQQGQGAAHADAASSSDSASSSTSSGSGVGTGGASGAGAAQEGGKGRHRSGGRLPVHIMLAFGGISGLAAQTVTYPLDVVRRRMQVDGLAGQRPSQAAGSSSISGGSSGSSGGATGSNGSSSGGPGGESGHARSMHAAASAQGSHACAAWPVGTQHQQLKRGTLATAQLIVREEGMRGLFRGLSLNYIKVVPSTAIGFACYDWLKHYLDVSGNL